MPAIASPRLLIAGLIALVVGWLFRGWASRNSLTSLGVDAAKSAAFNSIKSGQVPSVPNELTDKFNELKNASNVDRAKKVAGYGIRHFIASFVGIAGLVLILAGLVMGALGIFWK
jgi:hypothetical protein